MKKILMVMICAILSAFLVTAVYAAAPDAGAPQGQHGAKSGAVKTKKHVKSKREKSQAAVNQEAQKRRALILSGQ